MSAVLEEALGGSVVTTMKADKSDGILEKGYPVIIKGDMTVGHPVFAYDYSVGYVVEPNVEVGGECQIALKGRKLSIEECGVPMKPGVPVNMNAFKQFVTPLNTPLYLATGVLLEESKADGDKCRILWF